MRLLHASALTLLLALQGPALAKPPEGKGKQDGDAQATAPAHGNSGAKGNSGGSGKSGKGSASTAASGASGHGTQWEDHDRDGRVDIDIGFLQGFVRDNRYSGYQALPPGIRKNLARGKPIPPGLQSRVVPGPLLQQLPYRSGYEWRVYGTDLVLVALATGVVEEILDGIFD